MSHRLHSAERLKSKREIGRLFAPGSGTVAAYPLRILYRVAERREGDHPVRVAFTVPKKRFKRAVDRNQLKRRMREAYRLNKALLEQAQATGDQQLVVLFLYTGRDEVPFSVIEKKMKRLLSRLESPELG